MAKITINDQQVKVKNGTTILNAANSIGIEIPKLCFIKEINEIGFCRICVVEVEGEQDLVSACNTEIKNGMVIRTDSDKVIQSREVTLQLLASKHKFDCWRCPKDGECEFYDLLKAHDIVVDDFGGGKGRNPEQIFGTGISQDQTKCVLCKRCVAVCQNVVTANVLKFRDDDGMNPTVSPTVGLSFDEGGCIFCGQCVKSCPTGTLFETDHIKDVEALLRNKSKTVAVQISAAAKASIAEEFDFEIGTSTEEVQPMLNEALQLLGFDEITDTNWAAGLMIAEQSKELQSRLLNPESLPMFTSSCPAWIRYAEMYNPEFLENISSAKSPQMMQGTLIKNYFAPKYLNKKPEDIAVVSVMPCTASKYEMSREEMEVDGIRDVDAVLTVRELAKMFKRRGIDLKRLKGTDETTKLAEFSHAGQSHIAAGGPTVATLKALSSTLGEVNFQDVKGLDLSISSGMIQEATVQVGEHKLNVAKVHGGAAIKEMMKKIQTGKKQYHFVEVMACPGGCLNGGGQPLSQDLPMHDVIKRRSEALYQLADNQSSENDTVEKTYDEFLKEANSDIAQKFLHTVYSQKGFTRE